MQEYVYIYRNEHELSWSWCYLPTLHFNHVIIFWLVIMDNEQRFCQLRKIETITTCKIKQSKELSSLVWHFLMHMWTNYGVWLQLETKAQSHRKLLARSPFWVQQEVTYKAMVLPQTKAAKLMSNRWGAFRASLDTRSLFIIVLVNSQDQRWAITVIPCMS